MPETDIVRTPTTPFDVADYLKTPEDAALYLTAVLEDGDTADFHRALGTIARAQSMANVARETGLGRESLYKSLSGTGNPTFDTIRRVMPALGLRLSVSPITAEEAEPV